MGELSETSRSRDPFDIGPQPGPQEMFVGNDSDICFYGGQAGSGKTYGLLLSAASHIDVPRYGAVIFRRTAPQVTNEGGLWDETMSLYNLPGIDGVPRISTRDWVFPSGANIGFASIQYEKDLAEWQGSQIAFMGFDEVTHFTRRMFFYMLSRSRSACGVWPHIRATCNPVPSDDPIGGWVHDFLQWWIDPETGFAIEERSGKKQWLVVKKNEWFWADTFEESIEKYGIRGLPPEDPRQVKPKSVTFIPAKLSDNPILEAKDPNYRGNLEMQDDHVRAALLEGNWNAKARTGKFFKVGKIQIVDEVPAGLRYCRGWDLAATDGEGDWTVGGKIGHDPKSGLYYIVDIVRGQWESGYRDEMIMQTATTDDADRCHQRIPQDPGGAGKTEAARLIRMLSGFIVSAEPVTGSKEVRARSMQSQLNAGNFRMKRALWNSGLINRLDLFPTKGIADDEIDALADAFNDLAKGRIKAFVGDSQSEPDTKPSPYAALVEDAIRDLWSTLVAREPVHPAWKQSLPAFRADIGPRPSDDHKLRLIDGNQPWGPGNVFWGLDSDPIPEKKKRRVFI